MKVNNIGMALICITIITLTVLVIFFGDDEDAKKLYDEVLSVDEYDTRALYNKVLIFVKTNDYAEIEKISTKILFVEPNHWQALYLNVVSNINLDNMEKVRNSLDRINEIPDDIEIKNELIEIKRLLDEQN